MATQGVDVRQTSGQLLFRALLLDSSGDPVTSGTTTLKLYELQDDGTLASYDWNDDTFKATALTTETVNMTHRQGNNSTTDTGIWTYELETLTDFNAGQVYFMFVNNTSASPPNQVREFQFGSAQGDLTVTSARLNTNANAISESTTAADRLEAALTTANGIDVNMGQSNPGSPTADTVGESMRNAAQSLPTGDAPGATNGLARVTDLPAGAADSLRLVSTTMQASSTTAALIADSADLPTGDTDDIYNDLLVVAYDDSAGNKPNVRRVSDYDSGSDTFTLDSALDFTPEVGVDTFEIWAVAASDSTVTTELAKVTTNFSAANPNNLYSFLKAMTDSTATVPSGLGSYDPSTDALEVLRARLDLITGAGFSTGTDSLAAIRDAIDDLIAPAVVSSTGTAGVGFLSECITRVRQITDEPSAGAKYSNSDLVEYIHGAFDTVRSAVAIDTDHAILVRYDVSVVDGTQEYLLPCNVAEIWRIAKIDSTTQLPVWEWYPSDEFTYIPDGYTIEGNLLRLVTPNHQAETVQVLYEAGSEVSIHTATADSATASTLVSPASVTEGTLDVRLNAYAGCVIRTLSGTGAGQERPISSSSYDSGTGKVTFSVRLDWTTTPDDTTVYEVLPQYSRQIKDVVCLYAALDILANEAKSERVRHVEKRINQKMGVLRETVGKKVNRWGTRGPGADTWDADGYWGFNGGYSY